MYKDKIYNHLLENKTSDRILEGNLHRDECEDGDIFDFLSLLKRNFIISYNTTNYQLILVDE